MKTKHLIVLFLFVAGCVLVRLALSQKFFVPSETQALVAEPPMATAAAESEGISRGDHEVAPIVMRPPPAFRPPAAPVNVAIMHGDTALGTATPVFALESLIGPSAVNVPRLSTDPSPPQPETEHNNAPLVAGQRLDPSAVPLKTSPVKRVSEAGESPASVQRIIDAAIQPVEPVDPADEPAIGEAADDDSAAEPGLLQDLADISKDCPHCQGRGCSTCIGPLLSYRGTTRFPRPVDSGASGGRRGCNCRRGQASDVCRQRNDKSCSAVGDGDGNRVIDDQVHCDCEDGNGGSPGDCDCSHRRESLRESVNGLFRRPSVGAASASCNRCRGNGCSDCESSVNRPLTNMLDRLGRNGADSDGGTCNADPGGPGLPALARMGDLPRLCGTCAGAGCTGCNGQGMLWKPRSRPFQGLLGDHPFSFRGCSDPDREADGGALAEFPTTDSDCSSLGCTGTDEGCSRFGEVGGWFDWGTYDNSHGIDGINGNRPLGFNNIAEELQVHQFWLHAAREAETGDELNFGYRIDFLFGSDGPDTQSFGDGSWDTSWSTSNSYGFAMPQLYVEAAWQNIKVIVGHFYTIIGYEVVQAPSNFFYSRVYTFYYNEPFTHTGVLLKHELNDRLTMYHGWTAGWDTGFSNGNNGSVYLGGLGFAPTDDLSLIYSMSFGDPGDDPVNHSDTFLQSIVVDWMLTDRLEYVFHSDFQTRRSATLGGKSYGLSNYLFYDLTEDLKAGMRYEWFRDGRGVNAVGGASEHFHAITLGLNHTLAEGVVLRPEVRYDWVDRDDAAGPGGPFALGTKRSQFTWGISGYCTY